MVMSPTNGTLGGTAPTLPFVQLVDSDCSLVPLVANGSGTLIGRAKGKRFAALAGEDRIVFDQDLAYVEEESARHRRKSAED